MSAFSTVAPLHPFNNFAGGLAEQSELRLRITAAYRTDESQAVTELLKQVGMPAEQERDVNLLAMKLARRLRERKSDGGRAGIVQGLLQEYALSSQEGVALMCLAEALLRIPDNATRDALIRDKIADGQWQSHVGRSASLFVNAATWGLLLTGKLVSTHSESSLSSLLSRLVAKGGGAADSQRRGYGNAHDGGAVRHGRDHRQGFRACA